MPRLPLLLTSLLACAPPPAPPKEAPPVDLASLQPQGAPETADADVRA
jgi:hypothetical protein